MVIEREGELVLNMSANQAQSKPSDCVQVAVRSMSQLLILNLKSIIRFILMDLIYYYLKIVLELNGYTNSSLRKMIS